jgi:tryptophanyl-tRNA synthetase
MTDQAPAPYAGPQRVLSGVQPTGDLHLGNYLGALVKFARLQHEIETFIFVADLHAITEWQDPAKLKSQVREIAAAYLATGLDPKIATIFAQSAVREHSELAWVFNCVARLGWLDRMTQFKDKAGKHKERASVGLYTYPSCRPPTSWSTRRPMCPWARTRSSTWSSPATSPASSITTLKRRASSPCRNR